MSRNKHLQPNNHLTINKQLPVNTGDKSCRIFQSRAYQFHTEKQAVFYSMSVIGTGKIRTQTAR